MSEQELVTREAGAVANQSQTPTDLLRVAIEKDLPLEKIEKLMDLQERWEAKEAKKAFVEALAQFQGDCPDIARLDKSHTGQYAKIDRIVRAVRGPLQQCGLTFRFEIADSGTDISVDCIVTHIAGHSERASMHGPADTSGSKNPIQSRASTVSYLQRYTLCGALGIVTGVDDDDGSGKKETSTITPAQAKTIRSLLKACGPTAESIETSMLGWANAGRLEELPARLFAECQKALLRHKKEFEKGDNLPY